MIPHERRAFQRYPGDSMFCFSSPLAGEPVNIPATLGYEGGVWFRIRQGIRGLLAHDEQGQPAVYMVCEPSSHYYEVMTRSRRMPVLIGDRI